MAKVKNLKAKAIKRSFIKSLNVK